jgi:hypothetical protein
MRKQLAFAERFLNFPTGLRCAPIRSRERFNGRADLAHSQPVVIAEYPVVQCPINSLIVHVGTGTKLSGFAGELNRSMQHHLI